MYLHALAVCHVHVAAERAQRLREAELAVPRAHVHGGLALAVSCVEVRARVEQQQRRVGVVAPVREEWIISAMQGEATDLMARWRGVEPPLSWVSMTAPPSLQSSRHRIHSMWPRAAATCSGVSSS